MVYQMWVLSCLLRITVIILLKQSPIAMVSQLLLIATMNSSIITVATIIDQYTWPDNINSWCLYKIG